jgi:ASC-1-like (ASCH) protein
MEVSNPWFIYIKYGIKPVEGRKMSPTWHKIKIGDRILMSNSPTDDHFMVIVVDIKYYPSDKYVDPLNAYLLDVGIEKALPGIHTLEDARNIYLQWSTIDEIKQYGFMGIFIKLS